MQGRMWFADNPWPDGHAVRDFAWSGRLDRDGLLWFDLHLVTVDYDSEASPSFDGDDEWRGVESWTNFHSCTLSSTFWAGEATGILVGTPQRQFDLNSIDGALLAAEPSAEGTELSDEDTLPAFNVYLLGHDAVADHRIRFQRDAENVRQYSIEWTGRIAHAYVGDYTLKYRFRAEIGPVRFGGFRVSPELSERDARRLFAASSTDSRRFELHETPCGVIFRPLQA